jgi:hypothetical protein
MIRLWQKQVDYDNEAEIQEKGMWRIDWLPRPVKGSLDRG